ncbi:MAG: DUF502 domain-containing protein [Mangrovicoccus sp.]|nr:DUF502 domain-containing protein [Mangrovicoccus sp.]
MPEPTDHPPHRRPGLFSGLRASFLTGIVVIAPISLTFYLLWTVMGWIDAVVLPLVPGPWRPENYIGINLRGVGVIFFFVFTVLIGWIAKGMIGRSLIGWGESLVDQTPVVRTVYSGVKQIAETVFAQQERSFEKACMVEFPRRGIWRIAFIVTRAKGELTRMAKPGEEILTAFVPSTPNPTTGFLIYVPRSDVIELDMPIEDAVKLILSAGLVSPADRRNGDNPDSADRPERRP